MQIPTRENADLVDAEAWMKTELAVEHRNRFHWQTARAAIHEAVHGSGDPDRAWQFFETALATDEEESGTAG